MPSLALLLLFQLLGHLLSHFLPLPGPVLGLLLLTAALFTKLIKPHHLNPAAPLLLKNMQLFFAPVIVATLAYRALLAQYYPSLTAATLASLLTVLLTTPLLTRLLLKRPHHP